MVEAESFINEELSALRIAVFVVIQLYISKKLPKSRNLLVLLVQLIDGKPIVEAKALVLIPTLISLCKIIANAYEGSMVSNPLEQTSESTKKIVDEILFRILDTLWNIDTTDDLHHLVKGTYEAIGDPNKVTTSENSRVSMRSPIGRYVQKIAVSLKLLHFDETTILFNCIRQFRESSLDLYQDLKMLNFSARETPMKGEERISSPLFQTWTKLARSEFNSRKISLSSDDDVLIQKLSRCVQSVQPASAASLSAFDLQFTHSDLESLVDVQISLLERYGTPTPDSLRLAFKSMASLSLKPRISGSVDSTLTSSVHYLDYLENLNSGDYHAAFNSLHQYFDYMVSKGSKYFYHFALISKASLHQFFSEDRKALDSIEEAISVARENKDNSTLTYVLSWLFDFMRKKPSLWDNQSFYQIRNQLRLLDFLIKKSQSVSLLLAAISFRFETELLMKSNGSFLHYYESLFKATFLSIHDSIPSFIGSCHTSSSLWHAVGIRYLGNLYTELGAIYSRDYGTTQDHLEFELCKYRDDHAMGLQPISFDDFNSVLSFKSASIAQFRYLRFQALLIQAEIELQKGRSKTASDLVSSIPDMSELDPDFIVEKLRLTALILNAQGNFSSALQLLNSQDSSMILQGYLLRPNIINVIKLNFLRAQILITAGSPFRAFSLVIQHLELAKTQGYNSLVAEGFLLLLQILNETNNPNDAHSIAVAAIPAIISIKNLNLISLILLETAKSCCALLELGSKNTECRHIFEQLLHFLSLSISGFKTMRNLNMLNQCFMLENKVSSIQLLMPEIRETSAFAEFKDHSAKGLDVMTKRLEAECSYGYLT